MNCSLDEIRDKELNAVMAVFKGNATSYSTENNIIEITTSNSGKSYFLIKQMVDTSVKRTNKYLAEKYNNVPIFTQNWMQIENIPYVGKRIIFTVPEAVIKAVKEENSSIEETLKAEREKIRNERDAVKRDIRDSIYVNAAGDILPTKEDINEKDDTFSPFDRRYSQAQEKQDSTQSLQEGLQWLKEIMPDVQPELVNGLIDNIADGKYDILQDLITLSKDYATKAVVKEEAFHRAFSMLPQNEREKLLDEASKKYGISRGESKVTARYSQAQEKQIQYSLKAVELLQSDKAKEVFAKGAKNGWTLDKVLDEIGGFGNRTGYRELFTQEQLNSSVKGLNREQLVVDIISNYIENEIATPAITPSIKGHQTLEEFKKQKEDRIKELEKRLSELEKGTTKLNSNLSIFNNSQSSNFNSNNLKNDDLALMLFNQALGLNLSSITELTWDNIKDNIFFEKEDGSLGVKNLAFTSGNLLSTKKSTLNDFINQKGLFPEYKVFIGESIIYPNVFETLEEDEIIKQAIFENLFNLSGAFEQVKRELNNYSPETFVIETPKGKFTFPKRFAAGFWNIANKVEFLLKENQSSYIQDYLANKKKREEVIKDGKKIKPVVTQTLTVNDTIVQNAIGLIGNSIIENAIKNNTSVKIQVFSNTEYSEDGIAGWYLPASNTIYLHESMLKPQHLSEGLPLIAHELIHSVTEQSLQFDKNFQREIQSLLDSVKNQSNIKDFYGFKNTSEFLSEAFSSQEFRELLKNTQFSSTEKLSIWQKFVNAVLKLFNKNVKNTEKTIQSNAEQILNNIINQHSHKIGFVNSNITDKIYSNREITTEIQNIKNEINQLKQELERVETEGFGALRPIWNFYENTVLNILKKQGYNPVEIIDEYGNKWNEVEITPKHLENIRFSSLKLEYSGDLALEEKMAEEARTSKDEKVSKTLIGKFIQNIRNLFRNLYKERATISKLLRDLNQGRTQKFSQGNNSNKQNSIFVRPTIKTKIFNKVKLNCR